MSELIEYNMVMSQKDGKGGIRVYNAVDADNLIAAIRAENEQLNEALTAAYLYGYEEAKRRVCECEVKYRLCGYGYCAKCGGNIKEVSDD